AARDDALYLSSVRLAGHPELLAETRFGRLDVTLLEGDPSEHFEGRRNHCRKPLLTPDSQRLTSPLLRKLKPSEKTVNPAECVQRRRNTARIAHIPEHRQRVFKRLDRTFLRPETGQHLSVGEQSARQNSVRDAAPPRQG